MNAKDAVFSILENRPIAKGIYHLVLESNDVAPPATSPGQFAMVQVNEGANPLLRRPLSYLDAQNKRIEFLYRTVGKGTRILAQAKENAKLRVLGPLGNGFDMSTPKKNSLLVAGGMGIAPIYFLAMTLRDRGVKSVEVIYGACAADELVMANKLEKAGVTVSCVTEDGSAGKKGMATDIAAEAIGRDAPDIIYACGPHPMLKVMADVSIRARVRCQMSVEERMACGVGACLGCAVRTDEGYQRACCEGPVFDAEKLCLLQG